MNNNARLASLNTVNKALRELRELAYWEDEALGYGNKAYAPVSRENWRKHQNWQARVARRYKELVAARARERWRRAVAHAKIPGTLRYWINRTMRPPSSPGGAGFQRLARQTGIGRASTRSVGTSPKRRRSVHKSPNAKRRLVNRLRGA